jgi:hypothetical protein
MKKELYAITVRTVCGSKQEFKMSEWKLRQVDDVILFTKNDNSVDVTFFQGNVSWIERKIYEK